MTSSAEPPYLRVSSRELVVAQLDGVAVRRVDVEIVEVGAQRRRAGRRLGGEAGQALAPRRPALGSSAVGLGRRRRCGRAHARRAPPPVGLAGEQREGAADALDQLLGCAAGARARALSRSSSPGSTAAASISSTWKRSRSSSRSRSRPAPRSAGELARERAALPTRRRRSRSSSAADARRRPSASSRSSWRSSCSRRACSSWP